MRNHVWFTVCLMVALVGLTCCESPAATTKSEAPDSTPTANITSPRPTPQPTNKVVSSTSDWTELEITLVDPSEPASGRVELDLSGDGRPDVQAWALPAELVQPSVWMTQRLAFVPAVGGDAYCEQLDLVFRNSSVQAQRFELQYEIPKSFAAHVDEILFSQQPVRIVQPDPVVVFQVELPAVPVAYAGSSPLGQADVEAHIRMTLRTAKTLGTESSAPEVRAMQEAAVIMARQCDEKPDDEKTDCWLKYVAGFSGFLSADTLKARCSPMPSASNRVCRALAEQDPRVCIQASSAEDRDFCRLYYVRARCRLVEPELKQTCIFDEAMKAESSAACEYVLSPTDRSHCLAVVKRNEDYCNAIDDISLRKLCLKAVQDAKTGAAQPPAQPQLPATDGPWFDVGSAEAACKELVGPLGGYTLAQSGFGKTSLSCGYHPPVDPDTLASIKIRAYATAAEAKEEWDYDWGPRSMNREDANKLKIHHPDRVTFTYDAAHHFLAEALEKPARKYYIEAAILSGSAIFEYTDYRAESGSPAAWAAIVQRCEALVREKAAH